MGAPGFAEVDRLFRSAPFITELGLELAEVGPGTCTTVLPVARCHLQQDGFVHAGVQATVADHTAGAAAASLLAEGRIVLSVEFKINLLRPAKAERLVCRSTVLRAGRTVTVAESEVFADEAVPARLVSKATVTLAVVTPREGG